MSASSNPGDELQVLHQRLAAHFDILKAQRERVGPGTPTFALEHGLTDVELELLRASVCQAIQRGYMPRDYWLPFIIYAAETGYEYSGDEYWQTFAARTPGWIQHENRHYFRASFTKFADRFGGARPTGAWARHFSIICWPITHAVLPKDLQRQLVQLLFEYRTALTSDLLVNPEELGSRLAARTWHFSSRFQIFAQNTSLLGQVAAALLGNEEEESPYLLSSTLGRIVGTLSEEQSARTWLRDARSTANRVRTRGFRPDHESHQGGVQTGARERLPSAADPGLFLRLGDEGWAAYLALPDLSILAERLPIIHDHLNRLRVRVSGSTGAPLASRRLLTPGQRVRLQEWPDPRLPLLQLDGSGLETENRLLADQCVISAGPIWLFRVREPGLAEEVKGRFVRPGHTYVLVDSTNNPTWESPLWVSPCPLATSGVVGYLLNIPTVIGDIEIESLKALGVGAIADVNVRPAGVVPGGWDGEGAAEWLAGEDVLLAISSNRTVSKCIIKVDGAVSLMDWPSDVSEVFLGLTDLALGDHDVQVGLLPSDVSESVAEGSLSISIRAAQSRPSTGSIREGLVLLPMPIVPSLSELWDGRGSVQIVGPKDASVSVHVDLVGRNQEQLAFRQFKIGLPVDVPGWLNLALREIRGAQELRRVYDDSEAIILTVTCLGLGMVRLRCERAFMPLRWVTGDDRNGPFARLVNNAEETQIEIGRYGFDSPTELAAVDGSSDERIRWPSGGLLQASINEVESSVILPPWVRNLDDLKRARVTPTIPIVPRSVDQVVRLIKLASLWSGAQLAANPVAEIGLRSVLRATTAGIASLIGGVRWSHLERDGAQQDEYSFQDLKSLVGTETYQVSIANSIAENLAGWTALKPYERVEGFFSVLMVYRLRLRIEPSDVRFAEFLLRLASDASSLGDWSSEEVRESIDRSLVSPVLTRAARFLVLGVHLDVDEDSASTYRGWLWE